LFEPGVSRVALHTWLRSLHRSAVHRRQEKALETAWFILVALMLTAYVVLDGFDLGAGAISLFIARSHEERSTVFRTIGPVWDGNEVWLIAAGGGIYFAFPVLYAAAFSGFYLPLMIVLWLLMLRGIGIELRSHVSHPLWWSLFEFVFAASSFLLALFFGAAMGNVVRGVPLRADGYFFEALWTDFRVGPDPGILDWYTTLTGLLAVVALAAHGALYVALKTVGEVSARARRAATICWPGVVALTLASLIATLYIRPDILKNFQSQPAGWLIPAVVAAALIGMPVFMIGRRERAAFLCSAAYLIAMLGGAAFAMYPNLLPASSDPRFALTIYNAQTGAYSMRVGLIWWGLGMLLALAYFVFLYTSFRGKVQQSETDSTY
jgi:cytochrome d ubiquinol oxidase subunit II